MFVYICICLSMYAGMYLHVWLQPSLPFFHFFIFFFHALDAYLNASFFFFFFFVLSYFLSSFSFFLWSFFFLFWHTPSRREAYASFFFPFFFPFFSPSLDRLLLQLGTCHRKLLPTQSHIRDA